MYNLSAGRAVRPPRASPRYGGARGTAGPAEPLTSGSLLRGSGLVLGAVGGRRGQLRAGAGGRKDLFVLNIFAKQDSLSS